MGRVAFGGPVRRWVAGIQSSYSTSFSGTENPISEGGRWINGQADGIKWSNISITPGFARGQQIPDLTVPDRYNDSTSVLKGLWYNDQTVQCVVGALSSNTTKIMELECRVRTSLIPNTCNGYEILFSGQSTNPYIQIVRWNGPIGDFTVLNSTSPGTTIAVNDTLKATVIGTVITAYINGTSKLSWDTGSDNPKYASGKPGMGFFLQLASGDPAEQANYGFSSFSVTAV